MSCVVSKMVLRAEIRRNNAGRDAYGRKQKPTAAQDEIIEDAAPCFIWVRNRQEIVEGKSVVVSEIHGYFRKDADIQREDVITEIKNRRGTVVYDGPFFVDAIELIPIRGMFSHKDVILRRTRGT